MRKFVRLSAFMISALSLAFIVSCGDDDGEEGPDSLVGLYSVTEAIANDAVAFGGIELIPANTNITIQLSGAITAAATEDDDVTPLCDPISSTRIELTEDNEILYACSNSDATTPNGTWSINGDRDQLDLTFTIQGQSFPLVLINFSESGSVITGLISNLVLPAPALGAPQLGESTLIPLSNIQVEFTKD